MILWYHYFVNEAQMFVLTVSVLTPIFYPLEAKIQREKAENVRNPGDETFRNSLTVDLWSEMIPFQWLQFRSSTICKDHQKESLIMSYVRHDFEKPMNIELQLLIVHSCSFMFLLNRPSLRSGQAEKATATPKAAKENQVRAVPIGS